MNKYKNLISTSRLHRSEIEALGSDIDRMYREMVSPPDKPRTEDIEALRFKMEKDQMERDNRAVEEQRQQERDDINNAFSREEKEPAEGIDI